MEGGTTGEVAESRHTRARMTQSRMALRGDLPPVSHRTAAAMRSTPAAQRLACAPASPHFLTVQGRAIWSHPTVLATENHQEVSVIGRAQCSLLLFLGCVAGLSVACVPSFVVLAPQLFHLFSARQGAGGCCITPSRYGYSDCDGCLHERDETSYCAAGRVAGLGNRSVLEGIHASSALTTARHLDLRDY